MISQQSILWLIVTAVLLLLLPVAVALCWKRKNGSAVSWKPLLIGAIGFLVIVRGIELLVHMLCLMIDSPVSRFINGSDVAYVLYGIAMAGIFEECGRYIIIRYIMKKHKTRENMVMLGIGHGGMEVWAISLVAVLTYLTVALLVNANGLTQAMPMLGVTETNRAGFEPALAAVQSFGIWSAAAFVMERIFAMALHIALTVVVFSAVRECKQSYLWLAVALHAVFDLFPAMYQRGIVPMWLTEVWLLIWAVGIGVYAYRRHYAGQD